MTGHEILVEALVMTGILFWGSLFAGFVIFVIGKMAVSITIRRE